MGWSALVGVVGAPKPKPRLKRALTGAGTPGRRECPGSGFGGPTGGSFVFVIGGLKVKWSVCGSIDVGGSAEYGVECWVKSSVSVV